MTAVLNMKFYKFSDSKNGDRGINSDSMIALEKHNRRTEIDIQRCEIKSKQRTNINRDLSHKNVAFQKLDYTKIEEMKNRSHKSNSVGSFGLVFDFQGSSFEGFDIEAHQMMIEDFLKESGIAETFEQLSMHYHGDELRPHFHAVFSGWDMKKEKYSVNDFFSPLKEPKPVFNTDGTPRYKKTPKGVYKLDENGEKIPYTVQERENGAQRLQDAWNNYLVSNNFKYSNTKKWTSALSFPKKIWRRFTEEQKESVYYFRKLENLYHEEEETGLGPEELKKIEDEMAFGVLQILGVIREIEKAIKEEKNNDKRKRNVR